MRAGRGCYIGIGKQQSWSFTIESIGPGLGLLEELGFLHALLLAVIAVAQLLLFFELREAAL
jgi:hypothetical protein